jgi:hypothetical protein
LDLASRRQRKPVRPVRKTGQTDFVQNLPKDAKHLKSLSTSEQKKPWHNRDFLAQKNLLYIPQGETDQTGLGNRSGRFWPEQSGRTQPAGKLNTSSNRSPDSFHGSK